jgi:hypothetical protein
MWLIQTDLEVAFSSAYMDHSWGDVTARLGRPGLRSVPKPCTGSQILAVLHELRGRARERTLRGLPGAPPWRVPTGARRHRDRSMVDEAMTRGTSDASILQYVVDNIPYQIFWKDRD